MTATQHFLGAAPLFVLSAGKTIKGLYSAPKKWQTSTPEGNDARLAKAGLGCGYGMVCGHAYDVLDIDPRNGGDESLKTLAMKNEIPTPHYVVSTPSGGWHIYLTPLGIGTHHGFLPGLDLQGAGSFVFCPPTAGYSVLETWLELGAQPVDATDRLRSRASRSVPRSRPVFIKPSPPRGMPVVSRTIEDLLADWQQITADTLQSIA